MSEHGIDTDAESASVAKPSNRLSRLLVGIRLAVTGLNFIQLHYMYFIGTTLVSSAIFWGSSTPARSVSYTDALFLCVSAMTEAGLNTINLSTLNTWQQVMLFLLIIIGSAIFVSAFVVHVRLRAFEDRFVDEIDRERRLRRRRTLGPLVRSLSRTRSCGRPVEKALTAPATVHHLDNSMLPSPDVIAAGDEGADRGRTSRVKTDSIATASATQLANGKDLINYRRLNTPHTPDTARSEPEPATETSPARGNLLPTHSASDLETVTSNRDRISFAPDTRFSRGPHPAHEPDAFGHHVIQHLLPLSGVGARHTSHSRSRSQASHVSVEARARDESTEPGYDQKFHQHFLKTGVLSRNSTFHHMDENDRERLGGLEYKSVKLLAWLVPLYFVLWQLLGALALGAWVASNRPATAVMNGLNPWWVGAFNAVSAFNNSGMSLLDANMVAFQTSIFMLISMSLFILAGNTCYPIFLRLIVWTMWKLLPDGDGAHLADFKCVLRFLLDHPRRVYTNLFPSRETWWLFGVVVVLNGIDCAFFSILNIGNRAITYLSPGLEFLDGLFQAFAVRSGGFYVVPIPSTRISLQILYVVMMYISVYPVVITMRNSNVYEERSLGIYAGDPGYDDYERQHRQRRRVSFLALLGHGSSRPRHPQPPPLRRPSTSRSSHDGAAENGEDHAAAAHGRRGQKMYFVQQQLRAQLAHDLWWLVLAIWLIMIIEGGKFAADPAAFSVFNVIFEVVSGYATVGISVGVPDDAYSFSGSWRGLSKLILCAVMLRGRHRGLPVAIDKAIMLPRDGREQAHWEEEDARLRFQKAKSMSRQDLDTEKA